MKRKQKFGFSAILLAAVLALASPSPAQLDLGNYTISGGAEVNGLPRHKSGSRTKFEEYRDIPESVVVPQLELFLDSKRNDFYYEFESIKPGLDDQMYRLRVGRWGLLDVEFVWDQIPHLFNVDNARTPYRMSGGNYTLPSRVDPTTGGAAGVVEGIDVRPWVNANARHVDLKLYNGISRFSIRYTPTPGWTFTGNYGSINSSGKRAFGAINGPSPGSYNLSELAEPIDYQIHNIELGGAYAGNGWTLGLKYNGSLFHNNISTLVWDNPIQFNTLGGACVDQVYDLSAPAPANLHGSCRGRMDLYPSNQAHSFTLTGTAALPMKTNFMGTVSYGWRLQNDQFLPMTINSALTPATITRRNLDGDVRPLMINATLTNNSLRDLGLKAFYRYYDLDNRSKRVFLPEGYNANDSAAPNGTELRSFPYAYSKQNVGLDASYSVTRAMTAKLGYVWERMHREYAREVLTQNEHTFGPTFDVKPTAATLFRFSYRHSYRDAPNYDAARNRAVYIEHTPEEQREDLLEALRKFDQAARNRDRFSFFSQYSPWENLTFHGAFDFTSDRYFRTEIGTSKDVDYAPSVGFVYAPLNWISIFGDYNWERFDWKMRAIARNAEAAAAPEGCPDLTARTHNNCPAATWRSRGNDEIHTIKLGSDIEVIRRLLNLRLQYGFSFGSSEVNSSGNFGATGDNNFTPATDYPTIVNRWHEFLARLEYSLHKNVSLKAGYYFNSYSSKDRGVDIMRVWMGDVETPEGGPNFASNIGRSIFLGDRGKGSYQAHIGLIGVRFKF